MLLTAGYWHTTYWPESYWNDNYWPNYGLEVIEIIGAGEILIGLSPITKFIYKISPLKTKIRKISPLE